MNPEVRRIFSLPLFAVVLLACHHVPTTWQELATASGCTTDLLVQTRRYDSTQVMELAGSYRLVQIDTARGWLEYEDAHVNREWPTLRLWRADSAVANWRRTPLRTAPMPARRPIVGALSGYENAGFSRENPQAEVANRSLDVLLVSFQPQPMFDAPLWEFPIERLGQWGFGGYFAEGSYVVPVGKDGEPLGQRAGFYCAFRQQGVAPPARNSSTAP